MKDQKEEGFKSWTAERLLEKREERKFIESVSDQAASSSKGKPLWHTAEMISEILLKLEQSSATSPRSLELEWTIEYYVTKTALNNFENLVKIYDLLVSNKVTEDNAFWYNDVDNRTFFIPHEDYKVFIICNQNSNYIYKFKELETDFSDELGELFTSYPEIHIRRYWDTFSEDSLEEDEELQEYLNKGITHAIVQAGWLERYSDNLNNNQYIERPDLQYFKDKDFNFKSNGCGDAGYITSLGGVADSRASQAYHHLSDLYVAFLDVEFCLSALEEKHS